MSLDPQERDLQNLNTGRLMQASADVILPMLEKQREGAIARLIVAFRGHEIDKLPSLAAELSTIEFMKSEIKNKIQKAQLIERKIFNGNGNSNAE